MKAIAQDGYGSADVLELRDIDEPEIHGWLPAEAPRSATRLGR